MKKQICFNQKGITLIALIITIIILIILAGISISALTGSGLFKNAEKAKERTEIAQAEEKIKMAIMNLKAEEINGDGLTVDDLIKLNNDEIYIEKVEEFPVEVIFGKYMFNIIEDYDVKYIGKSNGTIITFTTNPEGPTNQNSIEITVNVKNPKGIKTIEKPDNTIEQCEGVTNKEIKYNVSSNGEYQFKVISSEDKETTKKISIYKFDTIAPKDFTPIIQNLKSNQFKITANVEDGDATDSSIKSGILKYVYNIDGIDYDSTENNYVINNYNKSTVQTIYITAYDLAGNYKKSSTVQVYLPNVQSNNITPPVAKITFNENNVTKTVLDYPILTLDGIANCMLEPKVGEEVTLEITMQKTNDIAYYYSLDAGITWNEYTGVVKTNYQADNMIQVKTVFNNTQESAVNNVKKYFYDSTKEVTNKNALKNVGYDHNYDTGVELVRYDALSSLSNNTIEIDKSVWGKKFNIYFNAQKSIAIASMLYNKNKGCIRAEACGYGNIPQTNQKYTIEITEDTDMISFFKYCSGNSVSLLEIEIEN